MPWLRFTADMDFKPSAAVTLAYRTGDVANVTRACAERALSGGKAVKLEQRGRHGRPVEVRHDQ